MEPQLMNVTSYNKVKVFRNVSTRLILIYEEIS